MERQQQQQQLHSNQEHAQQVQQQQQQEIQQINVSYANIQMNGGPLTLEVSIPIVLFLIKLLILIISAVFTRDDKTRPAQYRDQKRNHILNW